MPLIVHRDSLITVPRTKHMHTFPHLWLITKNSACTLCACLPHWPTSFSIIRFYFKSSISQLQHKSCHWLFANFQSPLRSSVFTVFSMSCTTSISYPTIGLYFEDTSTSCFLLPLVANELLNVLRKIKLAVQKFQYTITINSSSTSTFHNYFIEVAFISFLDLRA